MKKILAIICAVIIVICGGCITAAVLYNKDNTKDFVYSVNPDDSVTISDYVGKRKDVTIPDTIEDKPVTVLNGTFTGNSDIQSITLPDTVKIIYPKTFCGCTGLKSVNLPESVELIYSHVFDGCSSLQSITIPSKVTKIEDCTFMNCSSLTDVKLNDAIVYIGGYAFAKCTSLENIDIISEAELQPHSFDGCTSLKAITFKNKHAVIRADGSDPMNTNCLTDQKVILRGYKEDGLSYLSDYSPYDYCDMFGNLTFEPIK